MTDPNTPPNQPAAPKDYDALYKLYSEEKEYGGELIKMIEAINNMGLGAQETEQKKRELIDSWPERVRRSKILDKYESEREDLGITPGSA
jgi:hypothetical protein